MSIERMCELGQVSRTGWYRQRADPVPAERDLKLRDEIQKIALEWPAYGSGGSLRNCGGVNGR